MTEPKSYTTCDFCNCTMEPESYETMCPACLKKNEPEEIEFKRIMEDSVERQKDAHSQEWLESLKVRSTNIEVLPNYKENNVINEKKDNFMISALQARRSEALRMAYETCHKLGHFNDDIRLEDVDYKRRYEAPEEKQKRKKEQLLSNIEEVKELARNNMQFIMEG